MKLTIVHKGTTVIVDESDNVKDRATMRYSDQNQQVQETITLIINEINNSKK
jgi:hypothetical protein